MPDERPINPARPALLAVPEVQEARRKTSWDIIRSALAAVMYDATERSYEERSAKLDALASQAADAVAAVRQARDAQREAQEPTGWRYRRRFTDGSIGPWCFDEAEPFPSSRAAEVGFEKEPLYLHPPLSPRDALDRGQNDTARMDLIDEYLDGIDFDHTPEGKPVPILDWFIGDGSGHFKTRGDDWRDAVDHAREVLDAARSRSTAGSSQPQDGGRGA